MGIAQTIELHGYAHLRAHLPDLTSERALSVIGTLETVSGRGPIQALTPKQVNDSQPNTYSGNFGISEFPLHTDLAYWSIPPRYVALRCVGGATNVHTKLLVGDNLVSKIGKNNLQVTLAQPRRPINARMHLLRLLDRHSKQKLDILRWDEIFIKPATEKSKCTFDLFRKYLSEEEILEVCLSEPGDTLIIDNWRCFHGRSSAPNSSNRHIDRAYLTSINLK